MIPLNVRIGFFLALRALRRASLWTTGLIIFVMVLTFLNLVVISGILVGLLQGAVDDRRVQYTSDVFISRLDDKKYIENSPNLVALVASLPEVEAVSPRVTEGGTLEANYKTRKDSDKPNTAVAQIMGINPRSENAVSGLSRYIIGGTFLEPDDYDKVLIGSFLLKEYVPVEAPGLYALKNVKPGSQIRVSLAGVTHEVTVKGILKTKVQDVSRNLYMLDTQLRGIVGRSDGNVMQVAVKLKDGADPVAVRDTLIRSGADKDAKVQTFEDAQPQAFKDIINTFGMLGTVFSSIGLIVASVTIFIVIFVNALTRRKFIGILKGIGVSGRAIEISYVFQSIFYAVVGSSLGLAFVYGFLVPHFAAHPINFPFSDGILVAPVQQTFLRVGLLVVSTVIAGYLLAWMIIRKNTLDSILGRN